MPSPLLESGRTGAEPKVEGREPQAEPQAAPGLQGMFPGASPSQMRMIQRKVARRLARRASGGSAPPEASGADDAALAQGARGVEGAGQALPHLPTIQRAFGRHDVSSVKAQVGGPAAAACDALGAVAYATGDAVAFKGAPDLHTAAHEAAHVVQQRGGVQLKGAVGEVGDPYERAADEVADTVVRGGSAESLLDRHGAPASGRAPTPGTQLLQAKSGDALDELSPDGDSGASGDAAGAASASEGDVDGAAAGAGAGAGAAGASAGGSASSGAKEGSAAGASARGSASPGAEEGSAAGLHAGAAEGASAGAEGGGAAGAAGAAELAAALGGAHVGAEAGAFAPGNAEHGAAAGGAHVGAEAAATGGAAASGGAAAAGVAAALGGAGGGGEVAGTADAAAGGAAGGAAGAAAGSAAAGSAEGAAAGSAAGAAAGSAAGAAAGGSAGAAAGGTGGTAGAAGAAMMGAAGGAEAAGLGAAAGAGGGGEAGAAPAGAAHSDEPWPTAGLAHDLGPRALHLGGLGHPSIGGNHDLHRPRPEAAEGEGASSSGGEVAAHREAGVADGAGPTSPAPLGLGGKRRATRTKAGKRGTAPAARHAGDARALDEEEELEEHDPLRRQAAGATPGVVQRKAADVAPPALPAIELGEITPGPAWDGAGPQLGGAAGHVGAEAGTISGGGGFLSAIFDQGVQLVHGLVSSAGNLLSGAASRVVGGVGGALSAAFSSLSNIASTLRELLFGGLRGAFERVTQMLGALRQRVNGVIDGILQRVTRLVGRLRGAMRNAVMAAIQGGSDIVGGVTSVIRGAITSALGGLGSVFSQIQASVSGAVTSAINAITQVATQIGSAVQGAVTGAVGAVSGLIGRATAWIEGAIESSHGHGGGILGLIREAVEHLIQRVLSAVQRVGARMMAIARGAIAAVTQRVSAIADRVRQTFARAVTWAQNTARQLATGIATTIRGLVTSAINAGRGMVDGALSGVRGALRRVFRPLSDLLARKAAEYVAPLIRQAVATGQVIGQQGGKLAAAAQRFGAQAAAIAQIEGHDVLHGLLKPDGDHFSLALTGSAIADLGLGVSFQGGASLDVVVDYRHHEVGLFLSPLVNVGAVVGAQAGGSGEVTGSWGSVLSFGGNRGPDGNVQKGFGGAFFNAGVSVSGSDGVGASRGESLYVSGASPFASGGPAPAPQPQPQPGPGPAPTAPPAPVESLLVSEAVPFATGSAAMSPRAEAVVDDVVNRVSGRHGSHPSDTFRIAAVGEASRRWDHPGRQTAEDNNLALSRQRAQIVGAGLRRRVAGIGVAAQTIVEEDAMGSELPTLLDLPPSDDRQSFRIAQVSAYARQPPPVPAGGSAGGPAGPAGAAPPSGGAQQPPLPGTGGDFLANLPPYYPALTTDPNSRPTIGWDSSVGVSLGASAGVSAGATVGNSYSIFLGSRRFPEATEVPLRVALGVVKMGMDLAALNTQGLLRDLLGTIGAFVPDRIVDAITDFVIPLPPRQE